MSTKHVHLLDPTDPLESDHRIHTHDNAGAHDHGWGAAGVAFADEVASEAAFGKGDRNFGLTEDTSPDALARLMTADQAKDSAIADLEARLAARDAQYEAVLAQNSTLNSKLDLILAGLGQQAPAAAAPAPAPAPAAPAPAQPQTVPVAAAPEGAPIFTPPPLPEPEPGEG